MLFDPTPKEYVVYCVEHKSKPFKYYGMTGNLSKRLYTHNKRLNDPYEHQERLYRAIRALGEENFKVSVIERVKTKKEAETLELKYIFNKSATLNKVNNWAISDRDFEILLTKHSK